MEESEAELEGFHVGGYPTHLSTSFHWEESSSKIAGTAYNKEKVPVQARWIFRSHLQLVSESLCSDYACVGVHLQKSDSLASSPRTTPTVISSHNSTTACNSGSDSVLDCCCSPFKLPALSSVYWRQCGSEIQAGCSRQRNGLVRDLVTSHVSGGSQVLIRKV